MLHLAIPDVVELPAETVNSKSAFCLLRGPRGIDPDERAVTING